MRAETWGQRGIFQGNPDLPNFPKRWCRSQGQETELDILPHNDRSLTTHPQDEYGRWDDCGCRERPR